MAPRTHLFCVPFIGAGHGVNAINIAMLLATAQLQVHVLVPSRKSALKWIAAASQETNPNVHIEVLGSGQWEDWHVEDARQLVGFFTSAELADAVEAKMKEIMARCDGEKATAVIFNILMGRLFPIYKALGLKGFLLFPGPYYMTQLGLAARPDDLPDHDVTFKGIGGIDTDMPAKLGDAMTWFGPFRGILQNSMSVADGVIYSNTNTGLDGDDYTQPDMQHNGTKTTKEYMIGPILPTWLERGLDEPELLVEAAKASASNECIEFMNKQETKSVVYIALGSHCHFTIEQVKLVIGSLRKTSTKWILLSRENTAGVREALGTRYDDGLVTSWAPQVEIMVHPALKCVLSHGGFGTMVEGVFAGAPFITSPVASDQFIDTRVMKHLGICVGCIAEFVHEDAIQKGQLVPVFRDDGGKAIEELFHHLFASADGERELEQARAASRRLRRRMLDVKNSDGILQLQELRRALTTGV